MAILVTSTYISLGNFWDCFGFGCWLWFFKPEKSSTIKIIFQLSKSSYQTGPAHSNTSEGKAQLPAEVGLCCLSTSARAQEMQILVYHLSQAPKKSFSFYKTPSQTLASTWTQKKGSRGNFHTNVGLFHIQTSSITSNFSHNSERKSILKMFIFTISVLWNRKEKHYWFQ